MKNQKEKPQGILTSMTWVKNEKWNGIFDPNDAKKSNFKFAKEKGYLAEFANFAHMDKKRIEDDGYYIGYSPTMKISNQYPAVSNRANIKVIFLKSLNYEKKKHYVVGFYAFPLMAVKDTGDDSEQFFRKDQSPGQFKALPKSIHILENFVEISNDIVDDKGLLTNKKMPSQGYAYLYKDNIENMLDYLIIKNPGSMKLKTLAQKIKNAL
jgi:hypothetical protein